MTARRKVRIGQTVALVKRQFTPPSKPATPIDQTVVVGRHGGGAFDGESPLTAMSRLGRYDPRGGDADQDWVNPFGAEDSGDGGVGPASGSGSGGSDGSGSDSAADPALAHAETEQAAVATDEDAADADQAGGDGDAAQDSIAPGQSAFRSVTPGSLAEYPRIHVYVHGWAPGSREATETMFLQQGEIAKAWDNRVSNAVGVSLLDAYEPLLDSLHRADPDAAVLWYSWVDQSGTDTGVFTARDSLSHTEVNGRRLAMALQEAIGEGNPEIHLIGHSHGSAVVTAAALTLQQAPAHVTVLDCPEDWFSRAGGAAGMLGHVLPRLKPGRGLDRTFVDSYHSMFGRAYHADPGLADVVDVRLNATISPDAPAKPASQAHQYPVAWYAESALKPDVPAGLTWSPLFGFDTNELGSAYLGDEDASVKETAPRTDGQPVEVMTIDELDVTPVELTRGSPYVAFVVPLPADALLAEFDYEVTGAGRKTRLEVAVDRQLVFTARARRPVPARGRYLRLPTGHRVTLQFRLADPSPRSSVTITGLRLVRAPDVARNLDDYGAAATFAALGALGGASVTLVAVGALWGVRGALRRLFRLGRR